MPDANRSFNTSAWASSDSEVAEMLDELAGPEACSGEQLALVLRALRFRPDDTTLERKFGIRRKNWTHVVRFLDDFDVNWGAPWRATLWPTSTAHHRPDYDAVMARWRRCDLPFDLLVSREAVEEARQRAAPTRVHSAVQSVTVSPTITVGLASNFTFAPVITQSGNTNTTQPVPRPPAEHPASAERPGADAESPEPARTQLAAKELVPQEQPAAGLVPATLGVELTADEDVTDWRIAAVKELDAMLRAKSFGTAGRHGVRVRTADVIKWALRPWLRLDKVTARPFLKELSGEVRFARGGGCYVTGEAQAAEEVCQEWATIVRAGRS